MQYVAMMSETGFEPVSAPTSCVRTYATSLLLASQHARDRLTYNFGSELLESLK